MANSGGKSLLSMNDEDLVAAACEGNDAAVVVLVARYKDLVMHCASRISGSEALGLEATLRTMELVRKEPDRLAGKEKCAVQMYQLALRITRRVIHEDERRQRFHRESPTPAPVFDLDGGPPTAFTESVADKIQRCICAIPLKYRDVLVLRDIMGISYEDIAATIGESLERVRAMSDRARDELHTEMERS